jgi:hypothetical protein
MFDMPEVMKYYLERIALHRIADQCWGSRFAPASSRTRRIAGPGAESRSRRPQAAYSAASRTGRRRPGGGAPERRSKSSKSLPRMPLGM